MSYKKGRMSVIKEMAEWISKELSALPTEGKNKESTLVISGIRKAHKKTFQKLIEKEQKTIDYEEPAT